MLTDEVPDRCLLVRALRLVSSRQRLYFASSRLLQSRVYIILIMYLHKTAVD